MVDKDGPAYHSVGCFQTSGGTRPVGRRRRGASLETGQRGQAYHRPCRLTQPANEREGESGRSRQSEGGEGGHVAALQRTQRARNHERRKPDGAAHRLENARGRQVHRNPREAQDDVDLEAAYRPAPGMEERRREDAPPPPAIELREPAVYIEEESVI